ncbi:hypothetical protein M409DRAFT_63374 [Zasmidium cellare ATCC 36951]|uniref:Uncharacterized protein n=1 Tax=Zasmidium cellare ATCC 36951 TaxID=1080233 RepID=A0A6A6CX49_ZASCE|nr:uncharacterized protein M409DRAFT_63374 [Zasmidium cellare ATCC 36951]KAF2171797.1 hypothetical protein M409DRAFT_63374 [Zasmidium cellare ATCC 36951]
MLRRAVGTTLACVLSTSAFLLPPNTPATEAGGLAIDVPPVNTKSVALQLPCSECAFSGKQEKIEDVDAEDDGFVWIQGGANNVLVNITVSEDGQHLKVNGEPVYPLGLQDMFHSPKIYVNQIPSSASWEDIESGNAKTTPLQVTGHGVSIMEENVVSPEGDTLIPIRHTIFELENQPVSLDEVTIQLLKTHKGELLIVHAESAAPPSPRPDDFFGPPPEDMPEDFLFPFPPSKDGPPGPPPADFGKHKECKNLPAPLCKFRNIVEDKIMGMKKGGCHGRKGGRPHMGKLPGHIRPPHFPRPNGRPHHHGRPHHMRPYGHHGHHRHHFMHAFTRGLAAVLIPTMAGIAVGMTVSLLGLMVGRLIGFLWIKFYRGGRRGYASVALDESSADKADTEKEVMLGEEAIEPPPVYEDAPAYEEAVQVQK